MQVEPTADPTGAVGSQKIRAEKPNNELQKKLKKQFDEYSSLIDDAFAIHQQIPDVEPLKIVRVLLIQRFGIFNARGQGPNPAYIRSTRNLALKLMGVTLNKADNLNGLVPDIFAGITINEWVRIVGCIPTSTETLPQGTVDDYIGGQRTEATKVTEQEALTKTPLNHIKVIFDANYPALNLHLSSLRASLPQNMEKHVVGSAVGATRLLMGRLMALCPDIQLAEESSFGFRRPTLSDLGENFTIRLSPGVSDDYTAAKKLADGIRRLDNELEALMKTPDTRRLAEPSSPAPLAPLQNIYGLDEQRIKALQEPRTLIQHLLFTRIEKGDLGRAIIGHCMRREENILEIANNKERTLTDWALHLIELSSPKELSARIKTGKAKGEEKIKATLTSPSLESLVPRAEAARKGSSPKDANADREANLRLAVFQQVAKTLAQKAAQTEAAPTSTSSMDLLPPAAREETYASSSEGESDIEVGDRHGKAFRGKIVTPTGQRSFSQLTLEKSPNPTITEGDFEVGSYYEFVHFAGRSLTIPGYEKVKPKIVDLNPNLATPEASRAAPRGVGKILDSLSGAKLKVWIVDVTSSLTTEQARLYQTWKKCVDSEVLVTISSGHKHLEYGLNAVPFGNTRWAFKILNEEEGAQEKETSLRNYFANLRNATKRSPISQEIRKLFKEQGAAPSWGTISPSSTGASPL